MLFGNALRWQTAWEKNRWTPNMNNRETICTLVQIFSLKTLTPWNFLKARVCHWEYFKAIHMERKRNVIKTSDIFHNIPNPSGNHCKLLGIQIAMDRTGYDIVRMSATAVSKEKGAIDSIYCFPLVSCLYIGIFFNWFLFVLHFNFSMCVCLTKWWTLYSCGDILVSQTLDIVLYQNVHCPWNRNWFLPPHLARVVG